MTRTAFAIALVSTAAFAQAAPGPMPTVDDWNTKALASACVVLLGGVVFALKHIFNLYDRLITREVEIAKQARDDRGEAMDLSKLVLKELHGDAK